MPELPEVEVICRQLRPRIESRSLIAGDAHSSTKFSPALEALGAAIDGIRRRGKYLILDLDDERELIAHLGMTGSFSVVDPPKPRVLPRIADHDPYTRAVWRLDDGHELVFRDVRRFGRLRVVDDGDYADIPTLHTMGVEPLTPAFTGAELHARLSESSRPVKTQLLSQRPVAGVGNIYADEALHIARINPRARRIGQDRCDHLAAAIKEVLEAGIRNGGTTLRDYVNAEGEMGSNQHELAVYGRGGEPCLRCGTTLRSIVLDARTTTSCTVCQRY